MSELTLKDLECLKGLDECPAPFPPPSLTMEEYCEFVWENLKDVPPELLERQHQLKLQTLVTYAPFPG